MDILPTLIDMTGEIVPNNLDGTSLLPLITKKQKTAPHEHLVWTGTHSRSWGFLRYTLIDGPMSKNKEKPQAPPTWAIVKDDYLLRYTGKTNRGMYKDLPKGETEKFELFNLKNDASEKNNLFTQLPKKALELKKLYFKNAAQMKEPLHWPSTNWEQIMNSKTLF